MVAKWWLRAARQDRLPRRLRGPVPGLREDLNNEPHTHAEEQTDSRWAALESLREKL